jgi:hypothetical protein
MVAQEIRRVEQQGGQGAQRGAATPGASGQPQGVPSPNGGGQNTPSRGGWAALKANRGQSGRRSRRQQQGQPQLAQAQQGQGQQGQGQQGQGPSAWSQMASGQASASTATQSAQGVAEVLGQAQWQLSQELSANLKELRRVINQSQEIARKIEQVLGEGTSGQNQ